MNANLIHHLKASAESVYQLIRIKQVLQVSADEYHSRIELLRARVAETGLDVFIVTSQDSIYYLTGAGFEPLERPFFLLIRPRNLPVLLVPKLEHEHMKKAHNIREENIRTYWEYPAPHGFGWAEKLRDLIGPAKTVGVEPTLRQEIAEDLKGYSLHNEPLVERLRIVKSDTEIALIRRAAYYADLGVQRLLAASYYGSTVAEGFANTRSVNLRIIREVDNWDPLNTKVVMATWAAPRSAKPHSVPDLNDRLLEGPHVALVLTRVNGYAAESERTYFTTSPSQQIKGAFAAMTEARRIALEMVRPGTSCGKLDRAVNDFLHREGYYGEELRLHRTGHGFGLGNHEPPWVADGSVDVLAENMVISIEPGIYLQGIGGLRHSDTVLVTRTGFELLTRCPTDIQSLTINNWKPLTRLRGWAVRRSLQLQRKR